MSSKQKETTSSHQTQGAEQWVQDEGQSLYNNAAAAVPTTFTPYKGQRVADFGQDYNTAQGMARGMTVDSPELSKLGTVLDQLYNKDSEYLKGSTQDHMNPFTAAVLDPTLRNLNDQRLLQSNEDNRAATMAGAFGDPQAGIAHALSNDKFNTQVSDATNKAYSDAWQNAQGQENTAMARLANTGQGYGSLDQALFNKNASIQKILQQFGLADQSHQQQLDDVKYDDWKMAKQGGWALTRSSVLNQLLNNTPHDTISDGTSTKTSDDGGAGAMQLLGKLAGTALGAAIGGPAGASVGGSLAGGIFGGGTSNDGGFNNEAARASMGLSTPNATTPGFSWSPAAYFGG